MRVSFLEPRPARITGPYPEGAAGGRHRAGGGARGTRAQSRLGNRQGPDVRQAGARPQWPVRQTSFSPDHTTSSEIFLGEPGLPGFSVLACPGLGPGRGRNRASGGGSPWNDWPRRPTSPLHRDTREPKSRVNRAQREECSSPATRGRDHGGSSVMGLLLVDIGDMVRKAFGVQREHRVFVLPEKGAVQPTGLVQPGRAGPFRLPRRTPGDRRKSSPEDMVFHAKADDSGRPPPGWGRRERPYIRPEQPLGDPWPHGMIEKLQWANFVLPGSSPASYPRSFPGEPGSPGFSLPA